LLPSKGRNLLCGSTCWTEVNIRHRLCAGISCGLLSRWKCNWKFHNLC
jgi:hypothetical protein